MTRITLLSIQMTVVRTILNFLQVKVTKETSLRNKAFCTYVDKKIASFLIINYYLFIMIFKFLLFTKGRRDRWDV